MTAQHLHTLIDKIDEKEYNLLFQLLNKFISDDSIMPDEVLLFENAEKNYLNNDVICHTDVVWEEG
jgi:hypothetical protein